MSISKNSCSIINQSETKSLSSELLVIKWVNESSCYDFKTMFDDSAIFNNDEKVLFEKKTASLCGAILD